MDIVFLHDLGYLRPVRPWHCAHGGWHTNQNTYLPKQYVSYADIGHGINNITTYYVIIKRIEEITLINVILYAVCLPYVIKLIGK